MRLFWRQKHFNLQLSGNQVKIMRTFIAILFLLITFSSNLLVAQKDDFLINLNKNALCGKWKNSGWIFSSNLVINKNGTFKYFFRSCTKEEVSAGYWQVEGKYLVLTSNRQYSGERKSKLQSILRNLYLYKEKYLVTSDSIIRVNKSPYISAGRFKRENSLH